MKLKQELSLTQAGGILEINGCFSNPEYEAMELWLQPRSEEKAPVKLASQTPSSSFRFTIDRNAQRRVRRTALF